MQDNKNLVKRSNAEPIKLAITISGAVSLGSFEGGALYELLHTICKYNKACKPEDPQIKIDVFTGASAGGMTAAIATQHLLYDGTSMLDPESNPLYQAWVEEVDLNGLADLDISEDHGLSIFSSNLIQNIAKKYLGKSFRQATAADAHPAAAESIRVGLALSNLTGVDYAVEVWGGNVSPQKSNVQASVGELSLTSTEHLEGATSEFVYTKYADQQRQTFKQGVFNTAVWDEFTQFVISCGAFPFAFRPVDIDVDNKHFSDQGARKPTTGRGAYLFTDGGVFQNEPIGLAKAIVDEIDAGHLHNHNRFYVYIAPGLKGSSIDNQPLKLSDMDVVNVARSVAKAVLNQSKFQDWISTEQVNKQLAVFDRRVIAMKEDLINGKLKLTAAELSKVADPLLSLMFQNREEDLQKAFSRLSMQYRDDLVQFQSDPELGAAWLASVLVFETAAELGEKDEMQIFGVTADESELASGRLFAFTGFFDKKLRAHDYAVGRKKAREVMRTIEQIRMFVDDDDDKLGIDPALANYDVMAKDVDPVVRKKLESARDRMINYACHSMLKNWSTIKQLVLQVARVSSVTTLVVAVVFTLIIFSLGVLLGIRIAG